VNHSNLIKKKFFFFQLKHQLFDQRSRKEMEELEKLLFIVNNATVG